jgi:hypothetical protein
MKADEIAIETAKTGKVTAVVVVMIGSPFEKNSTYEKKLWEITFFCPAIVAKNSLNASPGSALDVLCHFSLCANFGNKTLLPIMTP